MQLHPSPALRSLVAMLCLCVVVALAGPAVPAARAQVPPTTVNVELILDASGSMEQRIGGETRMQIAKRVLKDVLAAIPDREGINVGFRIYGHQGDNTTSGKAVSCRSSELRVPIDGVDRAALDAPGRPGTLHGLDAARPVPDPGGPRTSRRRRRAWSTPWSSLTDGLETCGGDPCAAAAAINAGSGPGDHPRGRVRAQAGGGAHPPVHRRQRPGAAAGCPGRRRAELTPCSPSSRSSMS